jgi:hypothetical protein
MEKLNDARNGSLGNQQDLTAVLQQFEQWRARKGSGERIPQHLWQAAASVYPRYSANKIARCLRPDSGDLGRYVRPSRKQRSSKPQEVPQFMPLAVAPAGGVADCSIKLKDGPRARVTIRLKGAGVGPVIQLLRELWSRGA